MKLRSLTELVVDAILIIALCLFIAWLVFVK